MGILLLLSLGRTGSCPSDFPISVSRFAFADGGPLLASNGVFPIYFASHLVGFGRP
jgi:hypothetical protein